VAPLWAPADEVTETIAEALDAYKNKDYPGATLALETAAQLVRQMRAEGLTGYLPEPPPGWTAEKADSQAMGGMYYGGMVSAQRAFSRGDAQVTVRFITDSPMLQSYLMALNTPMLAQAGGMKVERIKRQRAVVQFEGDSGTVNIVIQGTLLVQVEGNSVTLDDLRLFAEAIDYDKLGNAL
jgi:hypothetical protein